MLNAAVGGLGPNTVPAEAPTLVGAMLRRNPRAFVNLALLGDDARGIVSGGLNDDAAAEYALLTGTKRGGTADARLSAVRPFEGSFPEWTAAFTTYVLALFEVDPVVAYAMLCHMRNTANLCASGSFGRMWLPYDGKVRVVFRNQPGINALALLTTRDAMTVITLQAQGADASRPPRALAPPTPAVRAAPAAPSADAASFPGQEARGQRRVPAAATGDTGAWKSANAGQVIAMGHHVATEARASVSTVNGPAAPKGSIAASSTFASCAAATSTQRSTETISGVADGLAVDLALKALNLEPWLVQIGSLTAEAMMPAWQFAGGREHPTKSVFWDRAARTPVRVERLVLALWEHGYPVELIEELANMLVHGARLGCMGPQTEASSLPRPWVQNLHGAEEDVDGIVSDYLQTELKLGRIVGPYALHELPLEVRETMVVSPFGLIPKPNQPGSYRMITNLSDGAERSMNARIPEEFGRVPGVGVFDVAAVLLACRLEVGPDTQINAAIADVEHAFRQIPLHPDAYPEAMLLWRGNYYGETRVQFGGRTGPALYAKLGVAVAFALIAEGVPVIRVADDHLVIAVGPPGQCLELRNRALALLDKWGIPVKQAKTTEPSTLFKFIGIMWDTAAGILFVVPAKWSDALVSVQNILRAGRCTRRVGQSLCGTLHYFCYVVEEGKAHLQALFRIFGIPAGGEPMIRPELSPPGGEARWISKPGLKELVWWEALLAAETPRVRTWEHLLLSRRAQPCSPRDNNAVLCDASGLALGVVWGSQWATEDIPTGWRFEDERRLPGMPRSKRQSSTNLEFRAPLLALQCWAERWQDTVVSMYSDNTGVVGAWKRRHSRNEIISEAIRAMGDLCRAFRIVLLIHWIPGAENIVADPISRKQVERARQARPSLAQQPSRPAQSAFARPA